MAGVLAAFQGDGASNAPFTPGEQTEIERQLDAVKQLVREKFDLTTEQLSAIDQKVDELKEAARHQGRRNWLYMFYGAVMSTFLTNAVRCKPLHPVSMEFPDAWIKVPIASTETPLPCARHQSR